MVAWNNDELKDDALRIKEALDTILALKALDNVHQVLLAKGLTAEGFAKAMLMQTVTAFATTKHKDRLSRTHNHNTQQTLTKDRHKTTPL